VGATVATTRRRRAADGDALVAVDGDAPARPIRGSDAGQGLLHGQVLLDVEGGLRMHARDDVDASVQEAGQPPMAILAQVHDQGLVAQGGELGGVVEEGLVQAAHVGGMDIGEDDMLGQVEGGGVERLGDHAGALGARGGRAREPGAGSRAGRSRRGCARRGARQWGQRARSGAPARLRPG